MPIERFINNGQTVVASNYTANSNTLIVTDASKLPTLSGGDQFHIVVFNQSNPANAEIMTVTSISGNTLTVTPASEFIAGSATSYNHGIGDTVANELSVDSITNLINQLSAVGDVTTLDSANSYSDTNDTTTLTSANSYSDTVATSTLTTAETYTDSSVASVLATANSYTDTVGNLKLAKASNLSDLANAATARTNLGLGNVENTALSTWAGSSNITTVGTLTTGSTGVGFTIALTTSTVTGTLPAAQFPSLTGPVTTTAGSLVTSVTANSITVDKLEQVSTKTFLGRQTAGAGDVQILTFTQARATLGLATNSNVEFAGLTISGLSADKIVSTTTGGQFTTTDVTGSGNVVLATSPALTGTPTAPTATGGTNTTQIATTAFVTSAVATAVTGLLEFQGSTNCSSNPNYPAASKGDLYIVTVAGKIGGASGTSVDVGDAYFAIADNAGGTQASVGSSWDVLEHNLVGALLSANNLSDVASTSTARTNLGLAIGSDVQAYDATLAALAAYNTNGIITQTAADTFVGRTITGTTNRLSVSNGSGVSGNPTLDISTSYVGQTTITTLGTIATGTWQGTKVGAAYGGTNWDSSASTGIVVVISGAWSVYGTTGSGTSVVLSSSPSLTTPTLGVASVTTLSIAGGSSTSPTLFGTSDTDTGLAPTSANQINLIAGGVTCAKYLLVSTVREFFVGDGTNLAVLGIDAAAGNESDIGFYSGSSLRLVLKRDSTAESGSNAGSNAVLNTYDDSGNSIGTALFITRSNLNTTIGTGSDLSARLGVVASSTSQPVIIAKGAASRASTIIQLQNSAGASLGNVGGCIFNHFADGSSTHTDGTEDTLYTDTTVANTLLVNGDKILARFTVTTVGSATATRRIRIYFAGIVIFDSTTITPGATAGTIIYDVAIIRVTSTTCRATVEERPYGSATLLALGASTYTSDATLTGLTLTSTNILKITGVAAGTGAASGDIKATMGSIDWLSAA